MFKVNATDVGSVVTADMTDRLYSILEKHTKGIGTSSITWDAEFYWDLGICPTDMVLVIEECFLTFLPEYEWTAGDMVIALGTKTVEELLYYFEETKECVVDPEEDKILPFRFNFTNSR